MERANEPTKRTVVRGGRVLNVFTGELLPADVYIEGERIAGVVETGNGAAVGPGTFLAADGADGTVIDATDRVVVPGYVEPHAHIGLLAEPACTLEQMAVTGTTTVIADTYPFMVTLSDANFARVLDEMQRLPVFVRWFLAPHARSFLADEATLFGAERLARFLPRTDIVAMGEFTRWPLVDAGDADLLAKIAAAHKFGKRVEGHGAGASAGRLQNLARHGTTSDHEAITPEQVLERMRLGFYTMLRHSSLRPDLPALLQAVDETLAHSNRIMLTADGPTPLWIAAHGYLDNLVRLALQAGVEPAAAYRMATLNAAMYYRIEDDVGSIAPGRRADLLLLPDLHDPTPELVLAEGRVIAENGRGRVPFPRPDWKSMPELTRGAGRPPAGDVFAFAEPSGSSDAARDVPTLQLAHTVITRRVDESTVAADGVVGVAMYDWRGRWVTRAKLAGFVDHLGGFASSYSPAYEMVVIGQDRADMALAAGHVMERGGGMVLVEDGRTVWELPLEHGGLFTSLPWADLLHKLEQLEQLMRERGYRHTELLYTMFFFGFDSLPDYRLTTRGVWDVRRQQVIVPPLRLAD